MPLSLVTPLFSTRVTILDFQFKRNLTTSRMEEKVVCGFSLFRIRFVVSISIFEKSISIGRERNVQLSPDVCQLIIIYIHIPFGWTVIVGYIWVSRLLLPRFDQSERRVIEREGRGGGWLTPVCVYVVNMLWWDIKMYEGVRSLGWSGAFGFRTLCKQGYAVIHMYTSYTAEYCAFL